jgi:multidrug efflux pump subunit AcrB
MNEFMIPPTNLEQVIPQLRDAVGPVILISGVGLLLLTMTNRLGRAIDRARILKRELARLSDQERLQVQAQIDIIYQRAKIIRVSILFSVLSALLAAFLVMTLFLAAWLHWEQAWPACVVFTACLASLCVSLVAFIMDINLSLHALKLELGALK